MLPTRDQLNEVAGEVIAWVERRLQSGEHVHLTPGDFAIAVSATLSVDRPAEASSGPLEGELRRILDKPLQRLIIDLPPPDKDLARNLTDFLYGQVSSYIARERLCGGIRPKPEPHRPAVGEF